MNARRAKEDIYLPEPATVLRSEPTAKLERFFEIKLNSGKPLGHMPGQFVEVSIPGVGEAPISVSSSPTRGDSFELVVRRVGNVTAAMHRLQSVERVGIRGPFGTAFPVDGEMKGRDVVFICGGIGLIPVRSAIQYVIDHRDDYGRVIILIGTKTASDRLFAAEIQQWRAAGNVTILETVDYRDEHWSGIEGVITTLIPLVKLNPATTTAVVCGPPIMYKFVITELMRRRIPLGSIFVSLERRMKCGVGKCGHCQINHIYVCRCGPVFRFSDIDSVEEAV